MQEQPSNEPIEELDPEALLKRQLRAAEHYLYPQRDFYTKQIEFLTKLNAALDRETRDVTIGDLCHIAGEEPHPEAEDPKKAATLNDLEWWISLEPLYEDYASTQTIVAEDVLDLIDDFRHLQEQEKQRWLEDIHPDFALPVAELIKETPVPDLAEKFAMPLDQFIAACHGAGLQPKVNDSVLIRAEVECVKTHLGITQQHLDDAKRISEIIDAATEPAPATEPVKAAAPPQAKQTTKWVPVQFFDED